MTRLENTTSENGSSRVLTFGMKINRRNQDIAAAYLSGATLREVADSRSLCVGHVRQILNITLPLMAVKAERQLPEGLTLRAAVDIEISLGFWPSRARSHEIWSRREEITAKAEHPKSALKDIREWVAYLDYLEENE